MTPDAALTEIARLLQDASLSSKKRWDRIYRVLVQAGTIKP